MNGSQRVHAATTTVASMQNTYSTKNDIMFVSQVMNGGIALGPRVDQLATSTLALAFSLMMMQLCRHYWEVQNLQQCA